MKNIFLSLVIVFTFISGCAFAAPEQKKFHPPQTEAEKTLEYFVQSYKEQVTAVLTRTYKRDSGDGVPWAGFGNGGNIGARCDFSEDNKSLQCSAEGIPRDAWKVVEEHGFKRIGQTDSFVFETPVNDTTDFKGIAVRVLAVLHDGLKLEAGRIVITAMRAREEAAYKVFPRNSPFHRPETEAEKALDLIFVRQDKSSDNMYDFAIGRPYDDHSKDAEFSALFTKSLLKEWAATEAQAVKEGCNGRYEEGELCGLDYNVIVCGQDHPDTFVYRTLKEDKTEAVIMYTWPEYIARNDRQIGPVYRMAKDGAVWKMDGADCGEGRRFNMPEDGHLSGAR